MVLVSAPAGYGKTVLLADWALAGQCPVAWLSLDPGDNDPARFWRHAVAALDQVRPGIGDRVGPLIGPPAPASFAGLLTALINDLDAGPAADEAVLVLDDYHVITARPVHDSVQFLLEHWPPGLRLVLTSRSDPPLGLARLRARGQLAELRAADLRFTADEAGALLREMAGEPGGALPGYGRGRADRANRGMGGRAAARGLVLARSVRRGRLRGRVHRQPPLCPGLPGRGSTGAPARAAADVPAGDVGAGTAQRRAVRRRHRAHRQPGPARAGGTGRPVPAAARRGARLVALPPPVRRSAPRPPAAGAGPGGGAAPEGGRLA